MKKLVFILLISILFSEVSPLYFKWGDLLPLGKRRKPEKKIDNVHFCDTLTEKLAGFCNIIRSKKVYEKIVQDVRNDEYDDAVKKCVDTPYDRRDCEEFIDKLENYLD